MKKPVFVRAAVAGAGAVVLILAATIGARAIGATTVTQTTPTASASGAPSSSQVALPALATPSVSVAGAASGANSARHVSYASWSDEDGFGAGSFDGTTARTGRLALKSGSDSPRRYADPFASGGTKRYLIGSWTSPVTDLGFGATEAIDSWNATTPDGSFIEVEFRGRHSDGSWTEWYTLGTWSSSNDFADGAIHRTSTDGQQDQDGTVYTDTFSAASGKAVTAHQSRVTLYRPLGTRASVEVSLIGTMASAIPSGAAAPSTMSLTGGVELAVPRFSQEIHTGEYPDYDGGGEAWCSPTSTSMVVYYWGKTVPDADLATVSAPAGDPQVDWAAMHTYDFAYDGAGNWPFNTAYAATFGLDGFVTRMRDLTDAERFLAAGIPVVASVSFSSSELPEAGYSTNGHLLVIVGITDQGDVIVNDPASASNQAVRRVYPRQKFENVWINHSGGVAYVIHPKDIALPAVGDPAEPNW